MVVVLAGIIASIVWWNPPGSAADADVALGAPGLRTVPSPRAEPLSDEEPVPGEVAVDPGPGAVHPSVAAPLDDAGFAHVRTVDPSRPVSGTNFHSLSEAVAALTPQRGVPRDDSKLIRVWEHADGYREGEIAIEVSNLTIANAPANSPRFVGTQRLSLAKLDATTWVGHGAEVDAVDAMCFVDRHPASFDQDVFTTVVGQTLWHPALDPHQLFVGDTAYTRTLGNLREHHGPAGGTYTVESPGTVTVALPQEVDVAPVAEFTTKRFALKVGDYARNVTLIGLSFARYSPCLADTRATLELNGPGVSLIDVSVTESAATGIAVSRGTGLLEGAQLIGVDASNNGASAMTVYERGENPIRNGADEWDPSVDLSGLLVERSRFDGNNTRSFNWTGDGPFGCGDYCRIAGVKVTRVENSVWRGNSYSDGAAHGLWFDLHSDNASIVGNVFADNAGAGLYVEVSRSALIESNSITGNAGDGSDRSAGALRIGGSRDVVVRGNVFDKQARSVLIYDDYRDIDPPDWYRSGFGGGAPQVVMEANAYPSANGTDQALVFVFDHPWYRPVPDATWSTVLPGDGADGRVTYEG